MLVARPLLEHVSVRHERTHGMREYTTADDAEYAVIRRSHDGKSPVLSLLEGCRSGATGGRPIYIAAPMVRYSKLPFRRVCLEYGTEVVYTPMMLAKEFTAHVNARDSDFSTNKDDRPLVVQFAANDPVTFARACETVAPYADAVGLNCGCPQRWAVRDGIGAHLMSDPEKVRDMVRSARAACGANFCLETKIRVHDDLRRTVDWARMLEAAGINYLVVHGRTQHTRSSAPCDFEAIRTVREAVSLPVVANGDVTSVRVAQEIRDRTGVEGVMAARGLMSNPALFAGYAQCPWSAIERLVGYACVGGLHPYLMQHHVGDMMDDGGYWSRKERKQFFAHRTLVGMLDWLDDRFVLRRLGEPGFGTVDEPQRLTEPDGPLVRMHPKENGAAAEW